MTYAKRKHKFEQQFWRTLKGHEDVYNKHSIALTWDSSKEKPIPSKEMLEELPEDVKAAINALVDEF